MSQPVPAADQDAMVEGGCCGTGTSATRGSYSPVARVAVQMIEFAFQGEPDFESSAEF